VVRITFRFGRNLAPSRSTTMARASVRFLWSSQMRRVVGPLAFDTIVTLLEA
jgi:hypothetical protein